MLEISVEYDRFTGVSRVALVASALLRKHGGGELDPMMFSARLEFEGEVMPDPIALITLQIAVPAPVDRAGAPMTQYAQQRRLRMLLDNSSRLDLGDGTYETYQLSSGPVYEIMCYDVPVAHIGEMSAARRADLRVGMTECALTTEQQEALAEMLRWATPAGFTQARVAAGRAEALLRKKARDRHPHLLPLVEVLEELRQLCPEVWADEWEGLLLSIPPPEAVSVAIKVTEPTNGVLIATNYRLIQVLVTEPMLTSLEVRNSEVVRAARATFDANTTVYLFEDASGGSVVAMLPSGSAEADSVLKYVSQVAGIRPEYLSA